MDINKLIGTGALTPMDLLPEDVAPVIERLVEGRLRSLLIIAEETDGGTADMFLMDMDDKPSRVIALIGALECLKRELLDMCSKRGDSEEDEE